MIVQFLGGVKLQGALKDSPLLATGLQTFLIKMVWVHSQMHIKSNPNSEHIQRCDHLL